VATEFDLVQSMLAGDEAAFERFFDTSYPLLYRFALVRLEFDRDAAGDVAQAAICKAIGKLRTFRGEAALLTWLCTFCRHELYAFHRRNPGRFEVELVEDDPEIRAALESLRVNVAGPRGLARPPQSRIDRATRAGSPAAALCGCAGVEVHR
jgi:RNA polymerase sigma-70 factor (ECF subfamily)